MNGALIYRARSRWLTWVAFGCAVTIHLAAIAIAESKSQPAAPNVVTEISDVIGVDNGEPPTVGPEEILPPDPVQPAAEEEAFPEENVVQRPIHPRKKTPVTSVVRSIGIGTGQTTHSGSVKALALYAPGPPYPYEARRGGITGSGIAELTVNPAAGNVIDARMAQTTGSVFLDTSTLETLRRWRFKTGTPSNVDVPITYTLTGVSY